MPYVNRGGTTGDALPNGPSLLPVPPSIKELLLLVLATLQMATMVASSRLQFLVISK